MQGLSGNWDLDFCIDHDNCQECLRTQTCASELLIFVVVFPGIFCFGGLWRPHEVKVWRLTCPVHLVGAAAHKRGEIACLRHS